MLWPLKSFPSFFSFFFFLFAFVRTYEIRCCYYSNALGLGGKKTTLWQHLIVVLYGKAQFSEYRECIRMTPTVEKIHVVFCGVQLLFSKTNWFKILWTTKEKMKLNKHSRLYKFQIRVLGYVQDFFLQKHETLVKTLKLEKHAQ